MSEGDDAKPEDDAEAETPPEEAGEEAGEDSDAVADEEAPQGLKAKLVAKLAGQIKPIIIAAVVIVVVAGGGAGVYFSGIFHTETPHEVTVNLPDPPVYHEIPRITVDLKPSPKHARPFIRLTLQAELQGETARAAFIANETRILDAMQSDLRNTTVEDLEGEQGTERLREDFTLIINRIIAPEVAITVLYKDILIR